MKQTKMFVIQAKDEFGLVKKVNEEKKKKNIFATQPIQKNDDSWVAFIYFESEVKE